MIGGLLGQVLAKTDRGLLQSGRGVVHIAGHQGDVTRQIGLLVVDIGAGDLGGVFHHGLDPVAEPVVHRAGHQGAEGHGDHHRGGHGDQGEQGDEAQVKTGAGIARSLPNHLEHAPAGGGQQGGDEQDIDRQDQQNAVAGRSDRTDTGRGGEIDGQGGDGGRDAPAQTKGPGGQAAGRAAIRRRSGGGGRFRRAGRAKHAGAA